jgi:putative membrane protein
VGPGALSLLSTPASSPGWVGAHYRQSPLLRRLVWVYAVFWTALAIHPVDRETWLLENTLVFALAVALLATHRRFAFSNLSHVSLFAFLVLHAIGAHYTYSLVPAGFAVQEWLGLARNHYDRLVHFAFGLLLAYPIRELALRLAHLHRVWSYLGPVMVVLAFSSLYEIIESWAARVADPELGLAYVGAQGDAWDGQKDMTLALTGAMLAMGLTALWRHRTGREPYLGLRARDPSAEPPE